MTELQAKFAGGTVNLNQDQSTNESKMPEYLSLSAIS